MIHSPDEFYATVISLFTGLNFPTTTAVNFIEHENPAVTDEPEQVYDQDSDDEEVELAYIRRFNNQNRKPKPKFNYQSNDYPLANHNRSSYQQQPYNQRVITKILPTLSINVTTTSDINRRITISTLLRSSIQYGTITDLKTNLWFIR